MLTASERVWLFYLMANIEVSQMEGDNNMALLIDPDGYIAEGTGDNFFMVKDAGITCFVFALEEYLAV